MEVKQKKLPKSQIELTFELTAEEFLHHFEHALEHLKGHVKVDGFRQGQAPAKMVEDKLKPEMLLMEAGDHAVQHVYSDYIKESNLEAVGQPEVKILKIAKGSPFVFTAIVTVLPEVELPDYKEIASKVSAQGGPASGGKGVEVTEEEVQDSLNYLQKNRAKFTAKDGTAEKKDFVNITYQNKDINAGKEVEDKFILGEGGFMKGFEDAIVGMKAGEEKNFEMPEKGSFKLKLKSVEKMELPEINDKLAKQVGVFDTLVDLKGSIKQGITMEKVEAEKQRKRGEILEKISEKTKFSAEGGPASGGELPQAIIDQEKQRLMEDLKNRVEQTFSAQGATPKDGPASGMGPASGWEQYLAAVKQTEDQLKETFQKEAEKRLKGFLILRQIGKAEKVEVSDKEVDEEVSKALKGKTLRQAQGEIDISQFREYTKGVLTNEKIFKLLECQ